MCERFQSSETIYYFACKENSAKSETKNISMHQFTIVYFCLMVFCVQMHNKIYLYLLVLEAHAFKYFGL